ncbi:MAG: hypothetical protein R2761_05610 [Acidimicrobiales bacterium]
METFRERLGAAVASEPTPGRGQPAGVVYLDGTGLGDGLPLVRPGDDAIAAHLAAWSGAGTPGAAGPDPGAEAVSGPVPIAFAVPTWWDLAACAVLAGAPVGSLPLMAAAIDALVDPAFNLLGVQATTGAAAPLMIVDGDAVVRFGLNPGANALGPGHRANATIGRAVRLVLQGVGQCAPGEGDMATHGHPGKYTWLVAANRADDPWGEPGRPGGGRVTVFAGVGNVEVVLPSSTPDAVARRLGQVTAGLAAPVDVVLLPPESAGFLDRHGWDGARLRAEVAAAGTGREPLVVVTGGTGVKATVVPGWGGGSAPVSRPVG